MSREPITAKKVAGNFLWRFFERTGATGVSLVVSIILARLLDPSDYGIIPLVTVFTTIMQVFVDSGLGSSLIQKKDTDDLDYSSVFFFNVVMCSVLYTGMFFAAPIIADFYEMPELTPIVRVVSLTIIISGVKNVQQAYISKHFLFKHFFFATLIGTIGAAIVGIWMAYRGFGVWALVTQNMLNLIVDTLVLWITVRWRPKLMFSWQRLRGLLSYGWKILVSKLVSTVYTEIRKLIIGKWYTTADLAFYSKGDYFPNNIVLNINTSIDSILMPTLSGVQDNPIRLKEMMRRAIKTSTYVMSPLLFGLAAIAVPLVRLLLTEKWLPCVFFLRVFCCIYFFQPIQTANLNAIKAIGRSDIFLKLEIIKKVVGLIGLFSTVFISVHVMALSLLITTIISAFVNSFPNKKFINYSFREQIIDILPYLAMGMGVFAGVYPLSLIGLPDLLTLLIQIPSGAIIYLTISILFRIDSYHYVKDLAKSFISAKFKCKKKESEQEES